MKLLKFYAEWCGPCKIQSKIIQEAGDKITVPVENLNIDENIFASSQYQIRSVPTMILVDDEGKELKRKVGVMKEQELIEWIC